MSIVPPYKPPRPGNPSGVTKPPQAPDSAGREVAAGPCGYCNDNQHGSCLVTFRAPEIGGGPGHYFARCSCVVCAPGLAGIQQARRARQTVRISGWAVEVASNIGLARKNQEDAWQIGFDWRLAGRHADVFSVFDGLGGEANGERASRAAAENLRAAMQSTPGAESLLKTLTLPVITSRGMTTAVIAVFVRGGLATLLAVGDSSAYVLREGSPILLLPHDTDMEGAMSDQLGLYFRKGQTASLEQADDSSLLLCSDGVDGVLPPRMIGDLLKATVDTMSSAVDRAMKEILERGAPDNATLILLRRLPAVEGARGLET